jgi:hypothetical protein
MGESSKDIPIVQVSWGELIDKVTILEIKQSRLVDKKAVANVSRELALLNPAVKQAFSLMPEIANLKEELRAVNLALWEIEDNIRAKEASKSFDEAFIELARSVYIKNDHRGALKCKINHLLNSEIIEEKKYTSYSVS